MELEKQLTRILGKPVAEASSLELYEALTDLVKERAAALPLIQGDKKVYYISAEFLVGKQLGKNLINLGIYDEVENLLARNGKSLADAESEEAEPSLGNGGLGRLAACFLDSISTLNLCGDGVGLNYHFGLFKQKFKDHKQYEVPDAWLGGKNMLIDTGISFPVQLAGKTYRSHMYDMDVIGYKTGRNRLHLFDLDTVDESIVHDGIAFPKQDIAKNLTLFLYPDDSDHDGKLLRIYQQYFMVSNAAQLIFAQERAKGHNLAEIDRHVAVQINDTHPSLVIPELIRLLIEEGIPMRRAAELVTNMCGYTNHTILAEALEKWPLADLQAVVPHLMAIIEALDFGVVCGMKDNKALNIIDDNGLVHMANMDMHYAHSINGVAALHTEILKKQELRPFFDHYPWRFNNKTNGITFRRWIMHSNHELANLIDTLIGEDWKSDANHLEKLMQYYNNEHVLGLMDDIKSRNKVRAAAFIKEREGVEIDPNSIFDVHVKRFHEYKRQQLNALWVIYKYMQIKAGNIPPRPITVFFGGKAAPAYVMAKNIIHLILCLQELINNDPDVSPYLRVVMFQNYNIYKSEIIIPAADISEQISLASKEASGTGNMKFMLNGALTLGTADGANVEIRQLVGDENIFIFGRTSDEVINLYNTHGYRPRSYYDHVEEIRNTVDFIVSDELMKIGDPNMLKQLHENLRDHDWFMTLLDLESYVAVKETALLDYENRAWWKRRSLVNIAKSGFFSSDRTIMDYNKDIWHLK